MTIVFAYLHARKLQFETKKNNKLNGLRSWLRTLAAKVDALPKRSFQFGSDYVIVAEPSKSVSNAAFVANSDGLSTTPNRFAGLDY